MSIPRQYSLVRYSDWVKANAQEWEIFGDKDDIFIFLGEIPNMPHHCVVARTTNGLVLAGVHTCDVIELTEEEL